MSNESLAPWKTRFIVYLATLMIALGGFVIMRLYPPLYWYYSELMPALFALLNIGLYVYLRMRGYRYARSNFWHQLFHWSGLLFAIYLVSVFVATGLLDRTQAGIMNLTLSSLAIFLQGVYTDPVWMIIGVVLGFSIIIIILLQSYLLAFLIPIMLITLLVILSLIQAEDRKKTHRA